MKKLFSIAFLVFLFSCSVEVNNSAENLEEILSKSSFTVERGIYGCFASNNFKFIIQKNKTDYKIESTNENYSKVLNQDEFELFKNFIENRLSRTENKLPELCTGSEVLRLSTTFRVIEIEESGCDSDWNELDQLIGIEEVWNMNYNK